MKPRKDDPIFGEVSPDPVGVMLKTEMIRFYRADGVSGLFKASGNTVEILAIESKKEKQGNAKRFLAQLFQTYHHVKVLHVWNPIFADALERWGFRLFEENQMVAGHVEKVEGWRCDR